MLNDHTKRAHALLSASSSARWLKCPPSAVAAEMYPSVDTDFTREGTLAHEVAEWVASGRSKKGPPLTKGLDDGVTQEMLDCARDYADYIQEQLTDSAASVLLEQRVDFSPWVPDGFGTADCIILQGDRMDVIDYKYGQGVAVAAEGNTQMRLYGLGAYNDFGVIYDVREIRLHIFQPRMNNVSTETLTVDELLAWGEEVKPIAALAAEGKGEHAAGPHCRFCPHAGACPTLSASCLQVVKLGGGTAAVPTLTPWMVAELLVMEPMISGWIKAVKDRALAALLNGEEVPGYKVVEGRGSRTWADELQVRDALIQAGHTAEDITKTELLSPYAMEKAIGKKRVAELVAGQIVTKPGAPAVAPLADKRKPFDRLAEARKDFE